MFLKCYFHHVTFATFKTLQWLLISYHMKSKCLCILLKALSNSASLTYLMSSHRNLCSCQADLCTVSSHILYSHLYLCFIYALSLLSYPFFFPLCLFVSHPPYRAKVSFLEAFLFSVLPALNN